MKIAFTGGGSGGHVTPNIAIIDEIKKDNDKSIDMFYIGSKDGIEKQLLEDIDIRYYEVSAGKLRRYLSKKNISDFFKVFKGIGEANKILKEERPDVLFSKGGFVSVPIVLAAAKRRIPIIIHESDMTPGLANKISLPFATKICVSFPETLNHVKEGKAILSGSPIRSEIFTGDKERGYEITGFDRTKPVILIMGGSLGAEKLNEAVRKSLDELLKDYQIIHLCGKGKVDESLTNKKGYLQYEYVKDELKDFFAITDLAVSRAGANSIFEFLALKIPTLLVPLSKKASRGDQILNAESFRKQGFAEVIQEDDINNENLIAGVKELIQNKEKYVKNMQESKVINGTQIIKELIMKYKKE